MQYGRWISNTRAVYGPTHQLAPSCAGPSAMCAVAPFATGDPACSAEPLQLAPAGPVTLRLKLSMTLPTIPARVGAVKLNVTVELACGCCGLTVRPLLAEEPFGLAAGGASAARDQRSDGDHRAMRWKGPPRRLIRGRTPRAPACRREDRLAMGERQAVEIKLEQFRERGTEPGLGLLGIVHQRVWHELQRALLIDRITPSAHTSAR